MATAIGERDGLDLHRIMLGSKWSRFLLIFVQRESFKCNIFFLEKVIKMYKHHTESVIAWITTSFVHEEIIPLSYGNPISNIAASYTFWRHLTISEKLQFNFLHDMIVNNQVYFINWHVSAFLTCDMSQVEYLWLRKDAIQNELRPVKGSNVIYFTFLTTGLRGS